MRVRKVVANDITKFAKVLPSEPSLLLMHVLGTGLSLPISPLHGMMGLALAG